MKLGNKERRGQRAFYEKTQRNELSGRRDLQQPITGKSKTQASPRYWYQIPPFFIGISVGITVLLLSQQFMMVLANLSRPDPLHTFWENYGIIPLQVLWVLVGVPVLTWYIYHRFKAIWMNNNAMFISEDIEEYANDAYVRTPDHIISEFDAAPDAGLGFDGHVSSLVGHMMISNKGIKKIDMPILDPDVDGQVARNPDGSVKTRKIEMFDKDFAISLFNFSNVPSHYQKWYNATEYAFNPLASKADQKRGQKRKGAFGRKEYDMLSDYINNEFYPLDTDTQRPAGVYFYDSRPVNTILIAITRGGKGYIARLVGKLASPMC